MKYQVAYVMYDSVGQRSQPGGRGVAIQDVTFILNEILEKVVQSAKDSK